LTFQDCPFVPEADVLKKACQQHLTALSMASQPLSKKNLPSNFSHVNHNKILLLCRGFSACLPPVPDNVQADYFFE